MNLSIWTAPGYLDCATKLTNSSHCLLGFIGMSLANIANPTLSAVDTAAKSAQVVQIADVLGF